MLFALNVLSILTALKECGVTRNLRKARVFHQIVAQQGYDSFTCVANTLIDMYSKCGCLRDAHQVFQGMEAQTVVSWNALILGYADNGESEVALGLFLRMEREGCDPVARTFVAALKACTNLASGERGRAVHLLASIGNHDADVYVANTLVDLHAKCGSMENALKAFNTIKNPTVVSWTSLILGYADTGKGELALDSFENMVRDGCFPDAKCIAVTLKACTTLSVKEDTRQRGRALHLLAFLDGFDSSIPLGNMLLIMYAKCGSMDEANKVFQQMQFHSVVTWNSLILGHADDDEAVMDMFSRMHAARCAPDETTLLAVLKSCSNLSKPHNARNCRGEAIHLLASTFGLDANSPVEGTLLHMYIKLKRMKDARRVFNNSKRLNVMVWTALILGYAENGEAEEALNLFTQMEQQGCAADSTAFAAALKACCVLGALERGRALHTEISARGFETDVVSAGLVHFYANCGKLIEAQQVFDLQARDRDLVTWTALIAGYTRIGDTQSVFSLLTRMLDAGLRPDGVTFSCVLTACNHAGLVNEGQDYFKIMATKHGLSPDLEHYTCLMDMLGRANKLDEAMALLRDMPFRSDAVTWMTLIGACRKWKNAELGNLAFESLLRLDERNSGAYVMLADISGAMHSTCLNS